MNIKCITINTHGLRSCSKRSDLFLWLQTLKPDVVFLQESHLLEGDKISLKTHWDGPIFLAPGEVHSAGVLTLFSKRLNSKLVSKLSDPSGRYLNTIVDIDNCRLQFCNVYAPNQVSSRKTFFENLPAVLKGGIPTVIGGDFNSIEDIFLDKNGGDRDLAVTALHALQKLKKQYDVKDSFRNLHPSSRIFTWNSADGSVSCRLDKFYVSGDIFCNIVSCNITHYPYSDHDAVHLSFQLPQSNKKGPGVWKFNTSLLQNEEFVSKIRSFWSHWHKRKSDFKNLNVWWDMGKKKIKHISIRF